MNKDITYVMGYWHISTNKKKPWSGYEKRLEKTFTDLKDCNIVFFYNNDDFLKIIKQHVKTNNIIYIRKNIDELKTFDVSKKYLVSCKNQKNTQLINNIIKVSERENAYGIRYSEKGLIHYRREYKKGGDMNFRKMFTVWTSKIYCISDVLKLNPFNSTYFTWCDISISRCNRDPQQLTKIYSDMKIHLYSTSLTRYKGHLIKNLAGFMFAHKDVWNDFLPIYSLYINKNMNSNYAHDEETLLYLICKDYPDFFKSILPANPH